VSGLVVRASISFAYLRYYIWCVASADFNFVS
jgi:hypothetical protein